ncbi:hypothetical protein DFJ73DRAFT_966634 [Zopfochytrium polystomum]|nr:hypothetical protein DFJ73DRAFT_966634 [Zopfochytrium polystomum]
MRFPSEAVSAALAAALGMAQSFSMLPCANGEISVSPISPLLASSSSATSDFFPKALASGLYRPVVEPISASIAGVGLGVAGDRVGVNSPVERVPITGYILLHELLLCLRRSEGADYSKKTFRSELPSSGRAVEYPFEDDDAWDESAVDAASAIDVNYAVEDAMKKSLLTSESPFGAAVKESTVSTTTAKAETLAKGAALSEKAAAANGEKVVRPSQVFKGAVNASSKKSSLLSSLNSFKSKAPNPDEVKHAKVGGGLINKFRTVEKMRACTMKKIDAQVAAGGSMSSTIASSLLNRRSCQLPVDLPFGDSKADKMAKHNDRMSSDPARSDQSPDRGQGGGNPAVEALLNLVPFIDWTLHGFFPGLGRDNRFLGGGADEDDDESDEDTEGGEDADQRDEDGNGEEDHDHHPPQPPPPSPLLPPPLVRGLPPVVRPIRGGGAATLTAGGTGTGRLRIARRERWIFAARLERSGNSTCFVSLATSRRKRGSKQRGRRKNRQEKGYWLKCIRKPHRELSSERLAALVAAAEEESRLHALVTEVLDPNLVEPFHVNMLPFEMGHHCSLPLKCRRYSGIIDLCLQHCPKEVGNVGYLTIDEGWVEPSETQRRPGLHIEAHCDVLTGTEGSGHSADQFFELKPVERLWGAGSGPDVLNIEGGIFQASNVPGSCRVWDCVLRDPCGAVGPHGSVEHLRSLLDRGTPASFVSLPIPVANRPEHLHDSEQRNPAPKRGTQHPAAEEGSRWRGSTTLAANELVWMTESLFRRATRSARTSSTPKTTMSPPQRSLPGHIVRGRRRSVDCGGQAR